MRVSKPVIVVDAEEIRVSAGVEIRTPCSCGFPSEIWFRFPAAYREFVSDRADGFAVSLLPLAMALGEPIEIEGALSPRLLRGMEDYRRIQSIWQPKRFEPVEIVPDLLVEPRADEVLGGVGFAFSGGVDSFHSLRRHLAENEPIERYRLTHCLMINGFGADRDLDDGEAFRKIVAAYRPMMDRLGIEILVSRTNIMEFFDLNVLKASYGAVITASALVLGRLLSRFLIPSAYRFDDGLPEGMHLMFDHLLGTDSLEVIHDAPHRRRLEKVKALSKWSETYSTLRVCWRGTRLAREDESIENCCRCEKCVRTMVTLKMAGALDRYPVFPRALRHRDIWRQQHRKRGSRIFVWDIMREAVRTGHIVLLFDYSVSLVYSLIGFALFEPPRAVHLFIERRSEAYARFIQRHHPRYKRGWRWIRKLND